MQTQTEEAVISIGTGLVVSFFTGPYWGALVIAFVASFTRTAFESACGSSHLACFKRWMRFFIMATGISFMMVSVAGWMALPPHPATVLAGFFACFAEETLTIFRKAHKVITNRLIKEVTDESV
jgi:hypothetical protein